MPENPKPEPTDPEQSKRFEETAKSLEMDETGKAFIRALKDLVPKRSMRRQKPKNP